MGNDFSFRETNSEDISKILQLYPLAFPDEDLKPVVTALLEGPDEILSIAAFDGEKLVAHILFTMFEYQAERHRYSLLAPLGVIPPHQNMGLGGAIVRAGLEQLKTMGVGAVFVLGDPAYYQRFGFQSEYRVLAPYPMPEEYAGAWQSMPLCSPVSTDAGSILLPTAWNDPALWTA